VASCIGGALAVLEVLMTSKLIMHDVINFLCIEWISINEVMVMIEVNTVNMDIGPPTRIKNTATTSTL
jgi:hypothetical protein